MGGIGLSPIISWFLNKNHFGFVFFNIFSTTYTAAQ